MGCTGAAIAGNIGFAVITVGLLIYFKKVWPIKLAPTRFYRWIMVATALMIGVVLPWTVVADRFLFDNLPTELGQH